MRTLATSSLFDDEKDLGPLNPDATKRRNRNGRRVNFHAPKGGVYHPCDARCTHAKGFDCSCACSGKNHGIHAK